MNFLVWIFTPICLVACYQAASQWRDGDGLFWLVMSVLFGAMFVGVLIVPFTLLRS